jgi:hypothetical protein
MKETLREKKPGALQGDDCDVARIDMIRWVGGWWWLEARGRWLARLAAWVEASRARGRKIGGEINFS